MRVLILALVVALAAYSGSSLQQTGNDSPRARLGRALLRRAREISDKEASASGSGSSGDSSADEQIKEIDTAEDIFVGSGNHASERTDGSSTKRDEIPSGKDHSGRGSGVEPSSVDNDDGSSAAAKLEGSASDESGAESLTVNANKDEIGSGESWGTDQGSTSANDYNSATEASASGVTAEDNSGLSADKTPGQQDKVEGSAEESTENTTQKEDASGQNIIRVTEAKTQVPAETNNMSEEKPAKKSTIAEASGSPAAEASGSGNVVGSASEGSANNEDDSSAEAIRKGMESLSRLLKPVASSLDFELYSGNAKPKEEEEEHNSDVLQAVAVGESEKAEEVKPQKPVAKVKTCKKTCALPMTYDQCANP
ncbi:predicted protein, partial [Nematostella vectensis]